MFVVVIHTEAQRRQRDAAFTLVHRHLLEAVEITDTDVEVAIGGQQDAVDAFVDKTLASHLVGQFDTRGARGGTTGVELIDGIADGHLVAPRGGLEHHPGLTGIDHQGHPVLVTQLVHQQFQRALDQRQPFATVHGTGNVHQEHQVGRRQIRHGAVAGLDADAQQAGVGVPR
ncbi:hypothetical protein D3C78_1376220 [compost metagenome]